jgi:hypothetical protein
MKKLSILVLVLAMASPAGATLSWTVSPVKCSYEPSDIITIGIVADFSYVGNFGIDDILTDNGGTASNPALHTLLQFEPYSNGEVINEGSLLIQDPYGQNLSWIPEDNIMAGEVLWSFTYHVPDVPASTIVTISATGVFVADDWYMEYDDYIEPLTIHVVPEPATIALLGLGGLLLRRRK